MKDGAPPGIGFADIARQVLGHRGHRPTAPALYWQGSNVSYQELADLTARSQGQLRDGRGIPDVVAIASRKSPRAIALILACFLEKRDVLLVSPDLSEGTLRALLTTAGCHVVLSLDTSDVLTCRAIDGLPEAPIRNASPSVNQRLMLTTSGSTGVPKIVPLSAAAILRFIDWAGDHFNIGPATSVLSYAPLNFDLSLLDVWTTLKHGGCAALVAEGRAMDGRHILSVIKGAGVTIVQGVPTLFHLLAHQPSPADAHGRIRHILITGDRIGTATLKRIAELCPTAEISNVYGATETNDSFIHTVQQATYDLDRPLPIGRPIPGVSYFLMNDKGMLLPGPGSGELWVATPFQTDGYLVPSMNSDRFVRGNKIMGMCGADLGKTFFRSGDRAHRLPDGLLALDGRLDSIVKVSGVRVNISVIEQAILEHDDVLEVAVLAVPDELAVHRLHAVVTTAATSPLNSLDLRRYCSRRLDRAAVPSTIIIQTDPLPRTPTGKIDRALCLRNP